MQPREFLGIILKKCPSYQAPLADCALRQLRKGDPPAPKSLDDLTEEEVDQAIRNHFLCVCRKDGCGL